MPKWRVASATLHRAASKLVDDNSAPAWNIRKFFIYNQEKVELLNILKNKYKILFKEQC